MYSGTLILATSWIDPEFLWQVGVFFMCFVKYAVAAGMAVAHFENPTWGYTITTIGGIAAAFFWIFFGNWAQSKIVAYNLWIKRKKGKTTLDHPKKFSKKNRWLVKIKKNGGLPILCFISPISLGVAPGCLIAVGLESDRFKIWLYMSVSIAFWGIIIFGSKWLMAF
jgi:hypothetical protein